MITAESREEVTLFINNLTGKSNEETLEKVFKKKKISFQDIHNLFFKEIVDMGELAYLIGQAVSIFVKNRIKILYENEEPPLPKPKRIPLLVKRRTPTREEIVKRKSDIEWNYSILETGRTIPSIGFGRKKDIVSYDRHSGQEVVVFLPPDPFKKFIAIVASEDPFEILLGGKLYQWIDFAILDEETAIHQNSKKAKTASL